MNRPLAAMIGFVAGMGPAIADAQTNIDQGKTPAQIFASNCAGCHKPTRRLAHGKNRFVLTEFLREHYTTSREQAAGLAAYVLGAGFGAAGAAALRGQKPEQAKPVKAEEEVPQTTKLQTPTGVEANPEQGSTAVGESPGRPELVPALESGDAADSHSTESPLLEPSSTSTAATPPVGQPGESSPVPRDDIPD